MQWAKWAPYSAGATREKPTFVGTLDAVSEKGAPEGVQRGAANWVWPLAEREEVELLHLHVCDGLSARRARKRDGVDDIAIDLEYPASDGAANLVVQSNPTSQSNPPSTFRTYPKTHCRQLSSSLTVPKSQL